MEEQRRQHRLRDGVTPVERPVEAIERAVERKRERAEERDAQPEEVQRRLIVGPPQPNPRADEQREQADGGQDEVHRARRRDRGQRDVERAPLAEPEQRIGEPGALAGAMLVLEDLRPRFDGFAVDRDQHVAARDSGLPRRRIGRNFSRRHAFGSLRPEHAILDFVQPRTRRDVRDAERHQDRGNEAYG